MSPCITILICEILLRDCPNKSEDARPVASQAEAKSSYALSAISARHLDACQLKASVGCTSSLDMDIHRIIR